MIRLQTQRFGIVERPIDSVLNFPAGIFGFELNRRWLLMGDHTHGSLFWLQSVDHPELSLVVTDPRDFIADFQLCVSRSQLDSLRFDEEPLVVLSVVTQSGERLSLNLRNPILISPSSRTGMQVVASNAQPFWHELSSQPSSLKHIA